jgi:hypothetical protein
MPNLKFNKFIVPIIAVAGCAIAGYFTNGMDKIAAAAGTIALLFWQQRVSNAKII